MERGDITEEVRELAQERRVSDRTVWRWFATMRASGSLQLLERGRLCDRCGSALPAGATIRRRFCGPACRTAHHRDSKRNRFPRPSSGASRQLSA